MESMQHTLERRGWRRVFFLVGALILALAMLGLAGCGESAPGPTPASSKVQDIDETSTDQLYQNHAAGEALYVFQYGDETITVENEYGVYLPWEPLEDGKFYEVIADVTYLNGGIAGYWRYPEIESVARVTEVSPFEIGLPPIEEHPYGLSLIGDYADGDVLFNSIQEAAVLKDGSWIYRYSGKELKLEDGTEILRREGVTEEDILAGMANGVIACEDYFVLPKREKTQSQSSS